MRDPDYLELKWGTLKDWRVTSPAAKEAMEVLLATPRSMSAMAQKDTPEQKEQICAVIDAIDGQIWLDWDGRQVSKEEAKKYVMEYGVDDATPYSSTTPNNTKEPNT